MQVSLNQSLIAVAVVLAIYLIYLKYQNKEMFRQSLLNQAVLSAVAKEKFRFRRNRKQHCGNKCGNACEGFRFRRGCTDPTGANTEACKKEKFRFRRNRRQCCGNECPVSDKGIQAQKANGKMKTLPVEAFGF
jgi:hypothetical protein